MLGCRKYKPAATRGGGDGGAGVKPWRHSFTYYVNSLEFRSRVCLLPGAVVRTRAAQGFNRSRPAQRSGTGGFSGDGGPAISAQLNSPYSVAVDASENLFIADTGNDQIRKVTDGIIMRVAGNGDGGFSLEQLYVPTGAAVDAAGNLFIADSRNKRIRQVGPVALSPLPGVSSFAQFVSLAHWYTQMTIT